jgi:hypothetical protein
MLKSVKYLGVGSAAALALALSAPVGALGAGSAPSQKTVALNHVTPTFAVLHTPQSRSARTLLGAPTWNFSYVYQATTFNDTFVGTNPTTGSTTTVPVYIIPIKLTLGGFTASPKTVLSNGKTVIKNTTVSPIFQKGVTFIQGSTNVGKTQYVDAFERAALWGLSAHMRRTTCCLASRSSSRCRRLRCHPPMGR